jgi:hypothetical protein
MGRRFVRVLGAVGVSAFGVTIGAMGCSTASEGVTIGRVTTGRASTALASSAVHVKQVCRGGRQRCLSWVRTDEAGRVRRFDTPDGLGASDLANAYAIDTSVDPHATIAIVDAFAYPNAESDLAKYRAQYGLGACTVASGCLTIVNQDGKTSPMPPNAPADDDWTLEAALDLDMASAACPKCKLLLVLANSDQDDGLFIAQASAAKLGATVISNSWGSSETAQDPASTYEHFFAIPGPGIFVASGDSGYDNAGQGPDYPATSAYVTAVGGTNLSKGTDGTWSETVWAQSFLGGSGGSACSLTIPKPAWQGNTTCTHKASADVAAVADPATGPAIYNEASGGWTSVGGTSAASPLVAAIYTVTGHGKDAPSFAYAHASAFRDVTSGANDTCTGVLCNAGPGWDGPTGIGAPLASKLKAAPCTPSCTGKACGNDGCGGSCGACKGTDYCSGTGACVPACVPSCTNKACGNNGCGGSCGTCAAPNTCDANYKCTCTPNCNGKCAVDDGCGGTCKCAAGKTCSSDNVCQ